MVYKAKIKSNILIPFNLSKRQKFNFYGLEKKFNFYSYNSISEIMDFCNDICIEIIFLEERFFKYSNFENIRDFKNRIILIHSGSAQKFQYKTDEILDFISTDNLSSKILNFTIEKNISKLKILKENYDLKSHIKNQEKSFVELHDIGISLSKGKDIESILETIITKSMQLTSADTGAIYLLEKIPNVDEIESNYFFNKQIRLKIIKNFSRKIKPSKNNFSVIPESIFGKVFLNGESVIIDNFDKNNKGSSYKSDENKIDKIFNYKIKSLLTVPIFNDKKFPIGAIQLVNRKIKFNKILGESNSSLSDVISFDKRDLYFLESIASQASVALNNTNLMRSVHILFDGFINASVRAIESRDPTTFGHSSRVAVLTLGIAETINKIKTGRFKSVNFNQDQLDVIRYASLLHDFGKIGVREHVLVKSKKLYADELQTIIDRFRLIGTLIELDANKKQVKYFIEESREKALKMIKKSNQETLDKLEELEQIQKFIIDRNEPNLIEKNEFEKLKKLARLTFQFPEGVKNNYLTKKEIHSLSIKKGSLNEEDRKEIESHVTHTYNFLKIIPWSKNLERVPEIAYAHHEKLNGKGYPLNLKRNEIPLESKMMTIADIYDALTAWDRPYKNSISQERALDILFFEANDNHIDQDILDIFVDAKLYNLVKRTK